MSNEKPIYLLAGGRGGSGESTNTILQIIFEDFHKASPTIAYVGAANEDNWVFFKLIAGMIKKAVDCRITRVSLCSKKANIQKAQDILNSADAVFMSGGDVEMGMQVLEAKNIIAFLHKLYQQGKLFFLWNCEWIELCGCLVGSLAGHWRTQVHLVSTHQQ